MVACYILDMKKLLSKPPTSLRPQFIPLNSFNQSVGRDQGSNFNLLSRVPTEACPPAWQVDIPKTGTKRRRGAAAADLESEDEEMADAEEGAADRGGSEGDPAAGA